MYIHRRPSKFALPSRFSTPLLCFSASLLRFFSSSSPLPLFLFFISHPLLPNFHPQRQFHFYAKTSVLVPRLVSRLLSRELSFVIRFQVVVSDGVVSRVRASSNEPHARTGNFDTPDGDKTSFQTSAVEIFFAAKKIPARLSTV